MHRLPQRSFTTKEGCVPASGDFDNFDDSRPLILAIRGIFPERHSLHNLKLEADLCVVDLPGWNSPVTRVISIEAFACLFDALIYEQFQKRQVLLLGLSTGTLVAQSMQSAAIRGRVLVEPFFTTAHLWPLIELVRLSLRSMDIEDLVWRWLGEILGYGPHSIIDRDYRGLAVARSATWALLGDQPLMPRRLVRGLPSLTSDEDRVRLARAGITTVEGHGGHDVAEQDRNALFSIIDQCLSQTLNYPSPTNDAR